MPLREFFEGFVSRKQGGGPPKRRRLLREALAVEGPTTPGYETRLRQLEAAPGGAAGRSAETAFQRQREELRRRRRARSQV